MIKFKLKIIKRNFERIFKIEKILEINDQNDQKIEDKTKHIIDNREYFVGQEIKDENLYRLKRPGIQLFYS